MIGNTGGNKEKRILTPINKVLQGLGIIVFSVLLFSVYIHQNSDMVYSADDNILQWGPVIRKVFDQIFDGNGIPYWDFYQYKGFDIFSSGYYGQLNPFMYFAYAVSRYIFSYRVETLTVYMITMFALGNLIMYVMLTDFGIKLPTRIIAILTYSTTAIFFSYAFYYFTFNNYFFIPFLLWILIHTRNNPMKWAVPGIVLSFSLLLGHIQYSCYYVMLYCVIQVVFCVQDKKLTRFLSMITSILTFAVLSSFIIMLSLSISGNRDVASEGFYFFADNVKPIELFHLVCGLIFKTKSLSRSEHQGYIGLGIFGLINLIFLYKPIKNVTASAISHIKSKGYIKISPQKNKQQIADSEENILSGLDISPTMRKVLIIIFSVLGIFYSVLYVTKLLELNFGLLAEFIPLKIPAVIIVACLYAIAYIKREKLKSEINRIRENKKYSVSAIIIFFIVANFFAVSQNFLFFVYVLLIAYYIYICVKKGESQKFTFKEKIIHAFLFGAVFFVLFCAGKNPVSLLMFHIPLISKFRYLYKCAYIYLPVLIFTGAFMIDNLNLKKQWYRTLISISVVLSVITAVGITNIYNSGLHIYINNKDFDYTYYRTIESEVNSRIEELGIDKNYRFLMLNGSIESSSNVCTYAFTKNYGAIYEIFTLNGYDSTFSSKNFEQSNMIMGQIYYEGQMENLVENTEIFEAYLNSEESIELFEKQMINNGVKYVLFYDDDVKTEYFVSLIEKCSKLDIVRTVPWVRGLSLIELSGVKSVCTYGDSIEIPVTAKIDTIEFDTEFSEPTEVTIFETYEPHYKMYLTDSSGNVSEAEVMENSDGYVTAIIPSGNYTAKFCYENSIMDKAVIMACVCLLLTLMFVVAVCINKRRCYWQND